MGAAPTTSTKRFIMGRSKAVKTGGRRRRHCGPIQAEKRKRKYAAQFAITRRNKVYSIGRHLKKHPFDKQSMEALERLKKALF